MRILGVLGAAAVVAALSACTEMAVIEGATVVGTDKTMTDHAISLYKGKNCSTVRKEKGLSYCVEDEPNPAPKVHCYPTLGTPTCYDDPDPFPGGQQEIGHNNRLTRKQ